MSSILSRPRAFAVALVVCLLSACGGADPEHAEQEGNQGSDQGAIRGGTIAGGQGAVLLFIESPRGSSTCTGVVIGPNAGLTAAHCFGAALGSRLSGNVGMSVSYTENGTDWSCLTSTAQAADGKCVTLTSLFVARLTASENDPEYDFAVFVHEPGFASFDDYRGLVVDPERGYPFTFWGAGVSTDGGQGFGPMRRFDERPDWMGERHFFTNAGGAQTCSGDSGGPYLWRDSPLYVMGIHSGSEKIFGGECAFTTPVWDGKQRANRMIASHVTFINDVLASVMGARAHSGCRNTHGAFYWCASSPPNR